MQVDDRSSKILDELVSNPSLTSKDIEKKFKLTRRQLGYSFDKINNWLLKKNLPEIERTRQGRFIIDQTIITNLSIEPEGLPVDNDVLSVEQRVQVIFMMLLSNDYLSLFHFTSELDVSKNTVLSDLKQAQVNISPYGLSIQYFRRSGYVVEGNEFQIRKLLFHVTDQILEWQNGAARLCEIAGIRDDEVKEYDSRINRVENELNLKFTDEKIVSMPYTLILILRRIINGRQVRPFYIKYEELSDTKEYRATEEILYDLKAIPMEEKLFITLHLLTTNVYWSAYLTEEEIPNLQQALNDMLQLFEKRACVTIRDREQLLNQLLLHVKPAYYRIKYHLTEINKVENAISQEFIALHHLVQQSTKPLADLIGLKIPESETTYLTMLIGGWLTRQGERIQEKVKAIVVCPNGVSVSRLMLSELRDLFPEFVFLDSLSVREFKTYKLGYDLVFSPIYLQTDKRIFIANSFLEREEKIRLRKQVMMELHGYVPSHMSVEDLLGIIRNHARIENEQELTKRLYGYIHRDDTEAVRQQEEQPSANLSDLITPETITLQQSVSSWEEAIRTSAHPLLESGHIETEYIEAMIAHCSCDPYVVIGPNIAIPHAGPDEGVNQVGMSLLKLNKGINFIDDHFINLVIVIAATDKRKHFKALMQLMKLAESNQDRNTIIKASTAEEIYTMIKKYVIND